MTTPARKPLRRTAWSMLIIGVAATGLMLGVGLLAVGEGEPAGPGQVAQWPANAEIGVFRPLGKQQDGDAGTVACLVTLPDGGTVREFPRWGERLSPDFAAPATMTCEQPATVLTGSALTVAGIARGSLIALPMFVAMLGILLFVPRFTQAWASLTQPLGGWVIRRFERDRPF